MEDPKTKVRKILDTTAQTLCARGHHVTIWLAGKAVERSAVAGWVGAIVTIPSKGGWAGVFRIRILWAALLSWHEMRRRRPDVVLAMGGFGSVGPCLAAWLLGVPYVLHESNTVPGRAVRFLSRGAAAVAVGFESALKQIKCCRVIWTGMPVRLEILSVVRKRDGANFCILVLGGSGGAHAINEVASAAICALPGRNLRVTHLTGPDDERVVANRYSSAGIQADVRAFSQDMAELYAMADFVICRAGASTCAELVALNIPALLIPLPWAADDHQTANARELESSSLADVIPQSDCSAEWLADYLQAKAESRNQLKQTHPHSKIPAGNAADRLAGLVEECACKMR